MPVLPQDALVQTDAVFVGTVTMVVPKDDDMNRVVSFDVDRSWKGVTTKSVSIGTARDSAACGIDFEAGKTYVVYAYESDEGGLWAGLCSRTHEVVVEGIEADEDVMALGTTTITIADPEPHQSAMASGAVTLVIGLVAVVAGIGAFRLFGTKKAE